MPELVKKCPECNSINLTIDDKKGEIVCKSCGLVLDENMVDHGPEWRFSDDDGKQRAGAPSSFTKADMGTSTQIGSQAEIYNLSGSQRRRFLRLRQWHNRSSTSLERNLKYALVELKRVSSILKHRKRLLRRDSLPIIQSL